MGIPTKEEIIAKVNEYSSKDHSLIEKAYDFAQKAHEGQVRESGDPFFKHPALVPHGIRPGSGADRSKRLPHFRAHPQRKLPGNTGGGTVARQPPPPAYRRRIRPQIQRIHPGIPGCGVHAGRPGDHRWRLLVSQTLF